MYDIAVIGSGPAGLTAATYSLRAGKSVVIIEKAGFGGQVAFSPKIENFPGTASISGSDLAEKLVSQALDLGADTAFGEVVSVSGALGDFKVNLTDETVEAKAVIIATGAKHRHLNVEGESRLQGSGVSYCAVCDGAFFTSRDVVIVGGGNSALQEAVMLSDICSHVTVVQNLPFLTGEAKLQDILNSRENVDIIYSATVSEIKGQSEVESIVINQEGALKEISCNGVFVAIGLEPQNAPFADLTPLDEYGYIIADESCTTKTPGVFVAGDCRTKSIRQIATAAGDGAIASVCACKAINSL